MEKGYVHVFTGNGKGKTTAAIGLAIRAAGAGMRVFFGQFIKQGEYSEIKALKRFEDLITIEQFGLGRFTNEKPELEDIQAARKGLDRARQVMASGQYDMVILDEANVAVKFGLIQVQELLGLIINKPEPLELVITGRYASPRIIEMADMVTEFQAKKHYYERGTKARVGIEM
ncbi:cob(I)yrinic acid a,c-diamide adenosyltransferase [Desulfatitalea alkaliphila]|uniref:corrinoid adenosyltransferase n=1 Tax=Desulfatitalea alkaliphila TaxID=2929485 RepID=A0AA41R033_9BACT|nr:cob(I)yrinic acid a,c-diamide adenosyltransferase [Desulfatitalea alkaliphila]MCJ8499612.1 cob(I)yrinic acid a,c-diamide adenosyltransferase [Desulfatitalea alkaliphila]